MERMLTEEEKTKRKRSLRKAKLQKIGVPVMVIGLIGFFIGVLLLFAFLWAAFGISDDSRFAPEYLIKGAILTPLGFVLLYLGDRLSESTKMKKRD